MSHIASNNSFCIFVFLFDYIGYSPNNFLTERKLTMSNKTIASLAAEISLFWENPSPYAKPYLSAMFCLVDKDSKYLLDSADDIVARFISNASGFRGAEARRIKAELKEIVGIR